MQTLNQRGDERSWLIGLGTLAALVMLSVAFAVAYRYWAAPAILRVGISVQSPASEELIATYGGISARRRLGVKWMAVRFTSYEELKRAHEEGRVDAAILNSAHLPANGQLVAYAGIFPLIILSGQEDVATWQDLEGKTVFLFGGTDDDQTLTRRAFDLAGVTNIKLEVGAELGQGPALRNFGAVAIIGGPGVPRTRRFVREYRQKIRGEIRFVSLPDAQTLAKEDARFSVVELASRSLDGKAGVPEDDEQALATSLRLVARSDLDGALVSQVTAILFQNRLEAVPDAGLAASLSAPLTEGATSAPVPVHPGAVDYYAREQKSLLERYGDLIWIGIAVSGGLSSLLAWLARRASFRRKELIDKILDRLQALLSETRRAKDIEALEQITLELDKLVPEAINYARRRGTSLRTMTALMVAIDAVRAAITDTRHNLKTV